MTRKNLSTILKKKNWSIFSNWYSKLNLYFRNNNTNKGNLVLIVGTYIYIAIKFVKQW